MKNENINILDMKSKDIVKENVSKIAKLFPECISEGKINFDMLKQELEEDIIEDGKERYQLTWVGKKEAMVKANIPCNKTLRPIKEKSVNFNSTKNIYIEGDNLEALKILQESYLNKIKCIYIDPPYNTGNDFVYNDKFVNDSESELEDSGQIDEYNNKLTANTESNGRFHSDWLNMIYPRIKLARNLLTEDGVIFISIDNNEVDNLSKICDEIFGEHNCIEKFVWKKTENIKMDSKFVSTNTEYILCYTKGKCEQFKKEYSGTERYNLEDEKGKYYLRKLDSKSSSYSKGMDYVIEHEGKKYYAGGDYKKYLERQNGGARKKDSTWLWSKEKYEWGLKNNEIVFKNGNIYNKVRYDGEAKKPYTNLIDFVSVQTAQKELDLLMEGRFFDHPKPWQMVEYLINLCVDENDIVMDFFAGSSTTAQAVMEHNNNNQFILVQIPEKLSFKSEYQNICDIGEERIKRAGEKIRKETEKELDYGFRVYKVDSSNMKDVYYSPADIKQSQLEYFESNIKEDRTAEDLLTQVMLDLGLTLDLPIEERKVLNNYIYFVDNNLLIACFDDIININVIDELCKYNPEKIVFKETSFKTDADKINIIEKIKKLSDDTEINII